MNPVERITLQQAKALVEKKLNKNIWRELERDFVWDEIVTAWDEAAELYARSAHEYGAKDQLTLANEHCMKLHKHVLLEVPKPEFKP